MLPKEQLLLLLYFIGVIVLLSVFVIIFFITFQRRKNRMLFEKFEAEKRFDQEIAQSRIEIQEETLKNVGRELHDNIGQLLSVANMQLNLLSRSVDTSSISSVKEIREVVGDSLQEVRALSKSLNHEVVDYLGLEESVRKEIDRFNRINLFEAQFRSSGNPFDISSQDTIILFRILQEAFSNAIKHSKAHRLTVAFHYQPELLLIEVTDDGQGFDPLKIKKGSGLLNMQSRAALINANLELHSSAGKGSCLVLKYSLKNHQK